MMSILFKKAKPGSKLSLRNQLVTVCKCIKCDHVMVNIDADQVAPGDMVLIKRFGVRISNPTTKEEYCLKCDPTPKTPFHKKVSNWFDDMTDDDDSLLFTGLSLAGNILSSSHSSSSSGGWGGFGGGSFGGGGASRGF